MAIFELCQYYIQWSIYPRSLKRLNISKTWERLMEFSPKAIFIISYVSEQVFATFWQKLMHTRCSLFSVIPNEATTQSLPFFIWDRMRLREARARVPTANKSRLVRTHTEEASSLGAHSYRKTYILIVYSTLHVYGPFHKECLIKIIHLQHQLQDIKRFDYNFKLFYLCVIYVLYKFWITLPENDP